jgi:hypothetical protein
MSDWTAEPYDPETDKESDHDDETEEDTDPSDEDD